MRSRKRALVAIGACILALAGCSEAPAPEPISTSTIVLAADGSFIQYRVEDFDSGYYQLSELDAMIRQEVQDYVSGASGSGTVAVEQVDTIEGNQDQVMVALRFANSHVYEDYAAQVDRQPCSLFYGTVGEAIEAGYELEGVLRDANKGEAVTAQQLQKLGDRHVLIFEDALQIRCPSRVLYTGGNVRLTEAGYVDGTEGEGLKYVVLK